MLKKNRRKNVVESGECAIIYDNEVEYHFYEKVQIRKHYDYILYVRDLNNVMSKVKVYETWFKDYCRILPVKESRRKKISSLKWHVID